MPNVIHHPLSSGNHLTHLAPMNLKTLASIVEPHGWTAQVSLLDGKWLLCKAESTVPASVIVDLLSLAGLDSRGLDPNSRQTALWVDIPRP